jgi:hypothetical protein
MNLQIAEKMQGGKRVKAAISSEDVNLRKHASDIIDDRFSFFPFESHFIRQSP